MVGREGSRKGGVGRGRSVGLESPGRTVTLSEMSSPRRLLSGEPRDRTSSWKELCNLRSEKSQGRPESLPSVNNSLLRPKEFIASCACHGLDDLPTLSPETSPAAQVRADLGILIWKEKSSRMSVALNPIRSIVY